MPGDQPAGAPCQRTAQYRGRNGGNPDNPQALNRRFRPITVRSDAIQAIASLIQSILKRSGGQVDSDVDKGTRRSRAEAAFTVLWRLRGLPGLGDDGVVDTEVLGARVNEVRRLCLERDREIIGDQQIGQILANAPVGSDGAWPCEAVRDLLDRVGSQQIGRGFTTGKFNLRGVTGRGIFEGGEQECSLSDVYRTDAARIAPSWPFTAQLLRRLADGYESDARQFDSESDWRDQFQ